jgi:CBS domain-containing protein
MMKTERMGTAPQWQLSCKTAADLMTPNPVAIRDAAKIEEAITFLIDRGYSAAPVIDEAGRPVGVISRTDVVVHDREKINAADYYQTADLLEPVTPPAPRTGKGDAKNVRDLMTPAVFWVTPDTPADRVAEQMVALNVHRLFVVDGDGILVGVISVLDLLERIGS